LLERDDRRVSSIYELTPNRYRQEVF